MFIICDGNGTDYVCKLGETNDCTKAEILSKNKNLTEPSVLCRVFIAYQKGDRLDIAVQKSVELGANDITLFKSDRCIAVPNDIPKKIARLQRISLETAKLCNRGIIPKISSSPNLETAVTDAISSDLTLFFYESEDQLHIKSVLKQHFSSISIFTGPEGGFEPHEVEYVRSKNIPIVSLGPRILRSETAPVVALAAIMYQSDNM